MNDAANLFEDLPRVLQDERLTRILAEALARNCAGDLANQEGWDNPAMGEAVISFINRVQQGSIDVVFAHAESEIELMFFNMLVIYFAGRAPGRFFLQGPSNDALESMTNVRENLAEGKQCVDLHFAAHKQLGYDYSPDAIHRLMVCA